MPSRVARLRRERLRLLSLRILGGYASECAMSVTGTPPWIDRFASSSITFSTAVTLDVEWSESILVRVTP